MLPLARNQKIARPLAMTDELTLAGRVLPVRGIREKVIAAWRARTIELILPEDARGDFEELPERIREGVQVHFVQQYKEVARLVFS